MIKNILLQTKKYYSKYMKTFCILLLISSSSLAYVNNANANSRIKDIVSFEGVRDNILIGYGLVVGLNGTGDSLSDGQFTKESLRAMLERLGIQSTNQGLDSNNVAAVMVTATLPSFARQGTRIDVTVSSLADSSSLQGGTLLVTPLKAADGQVYAVGQGQVAIGGFTAGGAGATVTQGVPTSGRIANGALVENEIKFDLNKMKAMKLSLRNPDFTTSRRVADAINAFAGQAISFPMDSATVRLLIPEKYRHNVVNLLTKVEQLQVQPDDIAQVVINEQNGIIVMGKDVRVSTVAIAQGNLTIKITENPQVSQPNPFSKGQTTVTPKTDIAVNQDGTKLTTLPAGVTLQSLVDGLNALGVTPRDMISILQAIKAAGALQAEIKVM